MNTYFITGSSGFLGSQIIKKIIDKRYGKVIAYDILEPSEKLENVLYKQGDILNKEKMRRAMNGADYVFHNAALVPLTKSGKKFHKVNVEGTKNVVDCCRELGVKKLIYMSSSAIYGIPKETPITEKTPYNPAEIYGKSKLEAEKVVWAYMQEGAGASCIRPRTIIGGDSRLGIFQILFEWISEDRNIYLLGSSNHPFQFIHVGDLINATIKAVHAEKNGLYNIGSEKFSTLKGVLEKLIKHAGKKSKVKSLPANLTKAILRFADWLRISPLAPWHYLTLDKPFVFDITKPMCELDWRPEYSDEESIIESYEWYLKNKNNLQRKNRSTHKKPVRQGVLKVIKWIS